MNREHIKNKLSKLALSMFRKDFFGIFHGSISAKTESNRFIINTKESVFDTIEKDSLIELYFKIDYRWKQASIDAKIHQSIYSQISDAKFITFTMPPYTTAYSLNHNIIIPRDYFGATEIGSIDIIDPKNFEDWYDRAESKISLYFQNTKSDLMIIKGYGIYSYNRDLFAMVKKLSILEKSCRLLLLDNTRGIS